jgi:hypothetical protein
LAESIAEFVTEACSLRRVDTHRDEHACRAEKEDHVVSTHRLTDILATSMVLIRPWSAAAQQVEIATTVAFTEGPTVDRDGNVYFTDIINQRI